MKDRTTQVLIGVALILATIAWGRGGAASIFEGLVTGGRILLSVTPLLVAAFLIAGLIQVLVSPEMVTRWLGSGSGWRGIALACVGGALIPGGPYVYYPIAAVLLKSGANLGVLITFITAKNLWSISRLPVEVALLGPDLTMIRFVLTLIIPPVLGIVAELLFGRHITAIRQGAPS